MIKCVSGEQATILHLSEADVGLKIRLIPLKAERRRSSSCIETVKNKVKWSLLTSDKDRKKAKSVVGRVGTVLHYCIIEQ